MQDGRLRSMNQDCKKKVVVGKDRYIFVRWDEGAKTDSLQVLGFNWGLVAAHDS
jgi:hypothetical protein